MTINETPEEAAEKLYPGVNRQVDRMLFIAGAEWQAKRYSEEVQNLIEIIEWYDYNSDVRPDFERVIGDLTMFQWFKQFKKINDNS